ncbi:hypothetical protein GCM10027034_02590 [Ramlibacter solisilvae]|uniref:Fasciclin n=1 Tax=Ramlibacter tataouinensis TaxID=94132 RepID=A0A127JP04_9BURK|nr:fasciclin domain-containing protein [Ramlibacter tataouinensis]AMO21643.1 fasciclin [Ramlibacter tataouinensis]
MIQRRLVALLPAAALLAACATSTPQPASVADALARDPELSTVNELVNRAGLSETLRTGGPYTFFAPTNAAFKAVPAKTMDELNSNPARLKAVLSYHVLPSRLMAADVRNGSVQTSQGAKLELSRAGSYVTVEDAMVQHADIAAANGVVHTVDRVLLPPSR